MPETIDSLELVFVNDGVSPQNPVFVKVPIVDYSWLHTVKARLQTGGAMTIGKIVITDHVTLPAPDEAILYDSGTVTFTASDTQVSIADALVPKMPLTSNFQRNPQDGKRTHAPYAVLYPSSATGAWTVRARLTVSRS